MTPGAPTPTAIAIFVDADACPVKDEVYRVAGRYGLKVHVVANAYINVPRDPLIERILVEQGPDVADDWIAERSGPGSIVITSDIPLASRCIKSGAAVLRPNGQAFTEASIGMALAQRDLMSHLRETGAITGGPPPMAPRDRSRFLSSLDEIVVRLRRTMNLT